MNEDIWKYVSSLTLTFVCFSELKENSCCENNLKGQNVNETLDFLNKKENNKTGFSADQSMSCSCHVHV